MPKMIQCFAFIFCVFFIVGCSDATQQKAESKKAPNPQSVKADKPLPAKPAKDVKVFTVKNAKAWKEFKGNTITLEKDGSVLLASSLKDPKASGPTQGAHIAVPVPQVKEYSGKTIQVNIVAAKAKENGTAEFAVAYSTAEVGNSGWKKFSPNEKFASYSFKYKVPKCKECKPDFIGVWSDTKGSGKGLLVKSVSVKILK